MPKKLTYEFVKDYIESQNYQLISKEYIGSKTKLEIKCPLGHEFKMTLNSFKDNNQRCPNCGGTKKHTYDFVKSYIENKGYKLLSTEYKNANIKLKLKCPKNHDFEIAFGNFQRNIRCPECAGNKKYTYEYIKSYIEFFGYKLLSTEYVNTRTNLDIQCNKGHNFKMRFGNFKGDGQRCSKCNGNKKYTYKEVKKYTEIQNYQLISTEYVNTATKMKFKCPEGHLFDMKYHNFKSGQRCPECNKINTTSKGEKEVLEYIKSIYSGKIIENNRTKILNPHTGRYLELDIYIPELKFAVEYNGTYWHSIPKKIELDKIKTKRCKELNINLLVIKEYDWINDREGCLNNINSLFT